MVSRASEFLPDEHQNELSNIVQEVRDVFRTKIRSDSPVEFCPIFIEFEGAAQCIDSSDQLGFPK